MLTKFHKSNALSLMILRQESFFHSKVKINSKSQIINVFLIVAKNKGAREIIVNKIVALIFVVEILDENVELLLILKISIK